MASSPNTALVKSPSSPIPECDPELAPSVAEVMSADIAAQTQILEETPADHAPHDDAESRQHAIERAAYFLAQARGFVPGHELDDWLIAERQIS